MVCVGGGGGIEREAGACFPESPAAPLGLGDSEGLKAGVFKAPLIFVSTESGPAWLWALDKAWLLLSHSGHFLGAGTLPPSLQGAPPPTPGMIWTEPLWEGRWVARGLHPSFPGRFPSSPEIPLCWENQEPLFLGGRAEKGLQGYEGQRLGPPGLLLKRDPGGGNSH